MGSESRTLQLPYDFYRAAASPTLPASSAFDLTVPVIRNASPSAPQETVPGDVLLALSLGVLLSRYNGQTSIPLHRSRLTATGELLRTGLLSLETASGTSFRDLLARFQAAPGVSSEGPDESSPVALTWLEAGESAGGGDGFDRIENGALSHLKTDLHLVIAAAGDSHRARFIYDSKLFRAASIERLAGHLRTMLAHVGANLDEPISRLPLLDAAERSWIEAACEGRARSLAPDLVHQLIERRAAAAPEAVALKFRDQTLSYAELNRRANQLASRLSALGIGAESRVMVCVEPSFDILIALLALLKAGAVYVPLDPAYPAARVRAILDDVRPVLIVTNRPLLERLPLDGFPVLALDEARESLDLLPGENIDRSVRAEQTAYIFFTSGTTGKPKGAMASQANLRFFIQSAVARYQITARDVVPAVARFGFSISLFELLSPLAAGGALVILDRDHVMNPERMSRTLTEVTLFHIGPSLLKHLIAHILARSPDFDAFSKVRHASSGGDMISPEVLESLKRIFSNAEVFVIYGCSEISCMGCTYPVPRDRRVEKTYVGRPFDDTSVRLLDDASNLVPVGVVGEIHFAGEGIVKGYLNREELTMEKFIELDGRRYYRTGDLGRLSEDGWIEILGRSDFQVKLRGMRIELGEVEHHLRRAPGVRDGVVTARDTPDGEKALAAYVVRDRTGGAAGGEGAGIPAIRRYMTEHLPDYMVPSIYVELDSLPLNHNMKVDRRALPEPDSAARRKAGAERRVRPPVSANEVFLASLWMKLLNVEQPGLDDNFFELGGHSLLATQMIVQVKGALGVALEGLEVLREPLAALAALCDRRQGKDAGPALAAAPPPPAADSIEVFHFGEGRSLYGVLHGAAAAGAKGDAVLICPPIGQESARAHFVLQRLSRRLAEQGVPALRFDYYACGDSLGESAAATCGRWQRDVAEAYRELKARTNAARITAVGARLGAALLCGAASGLDFKRLVLWDPVCGGAEHLAELAAAQKTYLIERFLWRLRPHERVTGGRELLGRFYSDAALRELESLSIAPVSAGRPAPVKWLTTSGRAGQKTRFDAVAGAHEGCRYEELAFDCAWLDLGSLEILLPDVGISQALLKMALEDE